MRHVPAVINAAAASRRYDDARVLAGRPICNPGQPDPTFNDDYWDLSGALPRLDAKSRSLAVFNWSGWVPDDEVRRLALKEFALVSLTRLPHPSSRDRKELPAISTVYSHVRVLVRFANFLGPKRFVDIEHDDLDAYLERLSASMGPPGRAVHVAALQRYFNAAEVLTVDPLGVRPWPGRTAASVVGYRTPLENTTARIPGPVIEPLLRWSLFYVQVASKDLLKGAEHLAEVDRRLADAACRPADALDAVRQIIERRRCAGVGMPAVRGPNGLILGVDRPLRLNKAAVAQEAGLHLENLPPRCIPEVEQAATELGLHEGTLTIRLSEHPETGAPWRPDLSRADLLVELDMLLIACYVVVAYLSGMRDDEIQLLEPGCCSKTQNSVGKTLYKIHSKVTKGRSGPVPETWIVLEQTTQAIEVLERLRRIRGSRRLLSPTAWATKYDVISTPSLARRINAFREHVDKVALHLGLPPIPHVDGRAWSLSPRQFRRTVAWYIANEPYGVVAGAIQYKHVGVKTFMGYAGESRSEFRAEIERERAIRKLEDFLVRLDSHRLGERSVGPGGKRLNEALDALVREIGPLPGRVIDEPRYRAMIEHVSRQLHPGSHNDCFFNPDRALCLVHERVEDRTAPLLNRCQPALCGNSSFSLLHRAAWDMACEDARKALANPRLSTLQREAIEQELLLMEAVLRLIEADASTLSA